MVTAVRASACVSYERSDVGTGRCRMSKAAFQKLNAAKMGSVLKLELKWDEKRLVVLCTAWPDASNYLSDDTICVDDSVLDVDSADYSPWVEAECKVSLSNSYASIKPDTEHHYLLCSRSGAAGRSPCNPHVCLCDWIGIHGQERRPVGSAMCPAVSAQPAREPTARRDHQVSLRQAVLCTDQSSWCEFLSLSTAEQVLVVPGSCPHSAWFSKRGKQTVAPRAAAARNRAHREAATVTYP